MKKPVCFCKEELLLSNDERKQSAQGREGREAVGEARKQAGKRQLCSESSRRKEGKGGKQSARLDGKRQLCSESSRRKEGKGGKQSARLENKPANVNSVAKAVGTRKGREGSSRRG